MVKTYEIFYVGLGDAKDEQKLPIIAKGDMTTKEVLGCLSLTKGMHQDPMFLEAREVGQDGLGGRMCLAMIPNGTKIQDGIEAWEKIFAGMDPNEAQRRPVTF